MKHLLSSVTIVAALAIATPALAQRTGPGPFAETGTGPGVVPPGGPGPSSPLHNLPAGSPGLSIAAPWVGGPPPYYILPPPYYVPPVGYYPAVRLLCPARPRLLRSAARLLLWAAGTVTRKSRLAGEPKDPGTACPSRVSSTWSRLPPCRCCVCRTWSRRAAHATPERRYQRRICGPSRHRRALSGGACPALYDEPHPSCVAPRNPTPV